MSNTDEHLDDAEKTIFDWVKEGNAEKVREFARKSSLDDSNITDSEGMGLIHWAADRGNLAMLKCLVKDLMADVDMRDGDGQTALHYAASCGHADVVQFLLDNGADRSVTDVDGMLPIDVASGSEIVECLNKVD
jgi:ankyrin repeat protein